MNKIRFDKPYCWNNLSFTQKVEYACKRMSYNYLSYTNKLIAKDIVKKMCGDKIKVAKIVKLLKDENDFKEKDMNPNHILKGVLFTCNILFNETNNFDIIKNKVKNHCYHELILNENYKDKKYEYKFIIEEIIDDYTYSKNGVAIVYLFKCINGIPRIFSVRDKFMGFLRHYYYDENKNLEKINMSKLKDKDFPYLELPCRHILDKMYNLACILSKPFEFVRIDLYVDKNEDIYFSEFTFLPGGLGTINHPPEIEKKLSDLWT